jgi:hypothetical protein
MIGDTSGDFLILVPFNRRTVPTRLALGFSKKFENLEAAVNLHMTYYNFCWRLGTMRVSLAKAAVITNRLWSFDDLMNGGR